MSLGAATGAQALSFGYASDSNFTSVYSRPDFLAFCGGTGASKCGGGGLGARYVRFFMNYDAFADVSSGCAARSGGTDAGKVIADLQAAKTDGLTPLISVVGPETWSGSYPTDAQYKCGLQQASAALTNAGVPVAEWEAFNEPDITNYATKTRPCATQAAKYFVDARAALGTGAKVVAGAFGSRDGESAGKTVNDSCTGGGYIATYLSYLKSAGALPTIWSWHPYYDVSSHWDSGVGSSASPFPQTAALVTQINAAYPSGATKPSFWLTESGERIDSGSDAEQAWPSQYGRYPNVSGTPQAYGAQAFLNIGSVSSQITREYWYQYDLGKSDWDSSVVSNVGSQDVLRPSYCVLTYADTPSAALSDSRCNPQAVSVGGTNNLFAFVSGGAGVGVSTCSGSSAGTASDGISGCYGSTWGAATGTSPSVARAGGTTYVAFNSGSPSTGVSVCHSGSSGISGCAGSTWGAQAGTSVAVAGLPNGNAFVAFNTNGAQGVSGCLVTPSGIPSCWGTTWGEQAQTTPTITALPDGNALVAFNTASSPGVSACLLTPSGFNGCWGSTWGETSGESPSIAAVSSGGAIAAFDTGSGPGVAFCAVTESGFNGCHGTGWGDDAGVSPHLTGLLDGNAMATFVGAGTLEWCSLTSGGSARCYQSGWGASAGNSPNIASMTDGNAMIAFASPSAGTGASTCEVGETGFVSCHATGWGLAQGANPTVAGLSNGKAVIAFDTGQPSVGVSECTADKDHVSGCYGSTWGAVAGTATPVTASS